MSTHGDFSEADDVHDRTRWRTLSSGRDSSMVRVPLGWQAAMSMSSKRRLEHRPRAGAEWPADLIQVEAGKFYTRDE